ncbi:late histone H1 [Penaeus vannamei]|uniref:late histone H1 n=1 Tax=Penaeus vannamei TaxID=6689 RepID=UPI00387F5EDB
MPLPEEHVEDPAGVAAVTSEDAISSSELSSQPKQVKHEAPKPTYLLMVMEAVLALNDRRGSSRQSIVKYIAHQFGLDPKKSAARVNQALKKAVETGLLKQTSGTGVVGSFKLGLIDMTAAAVARDLVSNVTLLKSIEKNTKKAKDAAAKTGAKGAAAKAKGKGTAAKPGAKRAAAKAAEKVPAKKAAAKKTSGKKAPAARAKKAEAMKSPKKAPAKAAKKTPKKAAAPDVLKKAARKPAVKKAAKESPKKGKTVARKPIPKKAKK